jgi:hypothetical protein
MRKLLAILIGLALGALGCSSHGAPAIDATITDTTAPFIVDSAPVADVLVQPECEWGGAPGMCTTSASCSATADHLPYTSTACATGAECCIVTPNVADNPPIPAGWKLMMQAEVTTDMTNWAVAILHDHVNFPMWSTTTMMFPTLLVLARVEWHPPDFQNSVVHRGVTLYEPM